VQFDLVWRPAAAGTDVTLVSFTHHFAKNPPNPDGRPNFDAVRFDAHATGVRADAAAGDLLLWRFSVAGLGGTIAYAPNGDGAKAHGSIPFIELPSGYPP
jgi:hypothetical protein